MRDYQRQKNNKYVLPSAVWHQAIWIIRDYYRLQSAASNVLCSTPNKNDVVVKKSGTSDEVLTKAIQREYALNKVRIIDNALLLIPKEYRSGIWDNVMLRAPFPNDADRTTYGRYKSIFVYKVAEGMGLIFNE